jgi:flagellar motor switch protein FliG
MKGAPEPVLDVIRKNVSERNREILEAEIKSSGPMRMKQVEEARAEVVQAIRALEAAGDISVRRTEEDDFVY